MILRYEDVEHKTYILHLILNILNLLLLIISTIIYCLITYKLKIIEMDDPNIYLTGITSFSFNYKKPYNPEYFPKEPNLGNTGNLIFDCYKGLCRYSYIDTCSKTICEYNSITETNDCHVETYDCLHVYYNSYYETSKSCRTSNYCDFCPKNKDYDSCSCSEEKILINIPQLIVVMQIM